jgi:N-acetylglucosamine-6-phosphate deacetylase
MAPLALPPAPFVPVQLQIAGAALAAVTSGAEPAAPVELDATGCTVLPGLLDVHVHGAVGRDTMDADPAALAEMAAFFARHGVTGFLATTMTAGPAETLAAVQAVAAYAQAPGRGPRARLFGIHLEGPYLSPRFPGAQLPEQIRPPDRAEFAALAAAGPVRMITLAPEQPGAHDLIRAARERGLVVVAGHTAATYDECEAAVALGVSQATHTYNAMTGLHHRQPGTLGSVLSNDAVDAQLIADNVHVHPAAMKVLARCKGALRTILITDAMRAVGLAPGRYELGGQAVTVQDGQCRLADDTLAGSVLTLEAGLANFLAAAGWTLAEGWPAASYTAARALGLSHELGQVAPGYRADLVLLDTGLAVVATVVGGRVVYLRDPERLRGDMGDDHPARAGAA